MNEKKQQQTNKWMSPCLFTMRQEGQSFSWRKTTN